MYARGLKPLSIASVAALTGAFALVLFYAPNDADQGFVQKIFYIHVPLAIVALGGFVAGGVYGIRHLRSGSFMSVRFAQAALVHPRVLDQTGGGMPGSMFGTFLVALLAMVLFFVTLWKFELTSKHARFQLAAMRRKLLEA